MCKEGTPKICEAKEKGCTLEVWRHNETVRDRQTKIAKIMCICKNCFERITGAK